MCILLTSETKNELREMASFLSRKTVISLKELQIQEDNCKVILVKWLQPEEREEKRNFSGKLKCYFVFYVMILLILLRASLRYMSDKPPVN